MHLRLISFITFALVVVTTPGYSTLWNRVIALYNVDVLTLWDIKREIQVERIRNGLQPTQDIGINDLKSMTKRIIVESLVVNEAESFKVAEITSKDMELALRKFREKFKTAADYDSFMKKYQWTEKEITNVLTRPIRVERFLREKILSAYILITDQDIELYRRTHKNVSHAEARRRIKRRRIQINLKEWIQGLKLRNEIRTIWE